MSEKVIAAAQFQKEYLFLKDKRVEGDDLSWYKQRIAESGLAELVETKTVQELDNLIKETKEKLSNTFERIECKNSSGNIYTESGMPYGPEPENRLIPLRSMIPYGPPSAFRKKPEKKSLEELEKAKQSNQPAIKDPSSKLDAPAQKNDEKEKEQTKDN